jgi:hypothetical protein
MGKNMEKKVDKNELINLLLLKLEEGKVFLNDQGVMFNVNLDNIRIMDDSVSIAFPTIYLRVDTAHFEFTLTDLVNNEVYLYNFQQDELKVRILRNLCYLKSKIDEVKPISREALMKILEALNIPYGKRTAIRFDININEYSEVEYNADNGLTLKYGLTEINVKKDKIIVDGLTIDINGFNYFISFEKGVMSIVF